MRYVAAFGHHRRAMARVAIRHEGQPPYSPTVAPPLCGSTSQARELEQAIPVMQAHRAAHPATPWLLTVPALGLAPASIQEARRLARRRPPCGPS